jgi:hypothetical protein
MGEVFSALASVGLAFTGKRSRLGGPSGELWPVGRACVGYIGSTASSVFATLSTF